MSSLALTGLILVFAGCLLILGWVLARADWQDSHQKEPSLHEFLNSTPRANRNPSPRTFQRSEDE